MIRPGEPITHPEYLAVPGDPLTHLRISRSEDNTELYKVIEDNPSLKQYIYWMNAVKTSDDLQVRVDEIIDDITCGRGVQYRVIPGEMPSSSADNGEIAGTIGVYKINKHLGYATYWLTEAAQGMGYGRRSVETVLDYAIPAFGFRSLKLFIEKGNERSQIVAERLGFTHRGSWREDLGDDLAGDGGRLRVIQVWRRDYSAN